MFIVTVHLCGIHEENFPITIGLDRAVPLFGNSREAIYVVGTCSTLYCTHVYNYIYTCMELGFVKTSNPQ